MDNEFQFEELINWRDRARRLDKDDPGYIEESIKIRDEIIARQPYMTQECDIEGSKRVIKSIDDAIHRKTHRNASLN